MMGCRHSVARSITLDGKFRRRGRRTTANVAYLESDVVMGGKFDGRYYDKLKATERNIRSVR